MKSVIKNRMGIKRIVFLNILIFSCFSVSADSISKMKNELGKEFTSLTGVYIMGGLIAVGLVIYLISNYVFKEKEEKLPDDAFQHSQQNHLRHKLRHMHKDTKK